jgi:hypothetical protein
MSNEKMPHMMRDRSVFKFPNPLKMDSVTRFWTSGFFLESFSPKPLSITLGQFRIFSKIRGDIRIFATGVVDTGGAP